MIDIFELMQLKVEPYERMRYQVRSAVDPKQKYLVDLLYNDGHGECDCANYRFKIAPYIGAKKKPEGWMPFCKHILRAQLWLAQGMTSHLAKSENRP